MNKHNLIQLNINLIDPSPAPSPSPSIDENYEEGIVLTEEDRYNYELDMSELIAEEKRSEEYVGVRFCE